MRDLLDLVFGDPAHEHVTLSVLNRDRLREGEPEWLVCEARIAVRRFRASYNLRLERTELVRLQAGLGELLRGQTPALRFAPQAGGLVLLLGNDPPRVTAGEASDRTGCELRFSSAIPCNWRETLESLQGILEAFPALA